VYAAKRRFVPPKSIPIENESEVISESAAPLLARPRR
jgi:hypothetical protein